MLDANKIKNQLTNEEIIKLCTYLQGDDNYFYDAQGNLIFLTCLDHDGGSKWKEYYYVDSKTFHCYTRGTSYDIYELVRRACHLEEFYDAFKYVCDFFSIKDDGIEEAPKELIDDWDIFDKIDDYNKKHASRACEEEENKPIQENILEYYYPLVAPTEWIKDGISPEVMRHFGIRIDPALYKIIIPHRDIDGNLIGIRGRNFDPIAIETQGKYTPVKIEEHRFTHALGKNLYGLFENKATIQRLKKVLVCESEKAVMQCATMYGIENNFCVATCGSNLSEAQMDLLINLGVEELILGYDKEYTTKKGEPETVAYFQKLVKHVQHVTQYMDVYIIMDHDELLGYKDSPTDRGKEVLEKLMSSKIYVGTISDPALKKRRKNYAEN